MRLAPGSLLWLVAHDARLGVRRIGDLFPNLSPGRRRLLIMGAVLLVHALAWPIGHWVTSAEVDTARSGTLLGGLAAVLMFAMSWMLAQSLLAVTRSLYVRGDLDLMLAAPMTAERVVAARALSLVAENLASSAVFLMPIANVLALQGHPHWLGLGVVLLALAFIAAAFGLAVALALFHLIGPRRARAVAQVIAMLIGGVVALGIQAVAVLPSDLRSVVLSRLDLGIGAGGPGVDQRLWLPLTAVRGDIGAMLLMLLPAVIVFVLVVRVLGSVFTLSVLRSAGADLTPHRAAKSQKAVRFTADAGASLRAKELKLLTRDPWILGQLVLQMVYTLPVALILWRSGIGAIVPAVAVTPSLVIIAAQMSGSLAWIAISGEDAPEFMATAPVARGSAERRKLEVIGLVVGGTLLIPLVLLASSAPLAGLIALAFCLAAGVSCALINLWHPTDGRRRSFMRRHAQSKLVSLFEHALLLLWAIAAAVAQMGTAVAILPVLLALLLLGMARRVLVRRIAPVAATGTRLAATRRQPLPAA